MKTIALYNIKGGVGKTAAAVNLSYLAARDGMRTLLIDLDPQSAATFYFRIRPATKRKTKKLIKGGNAFDKRIKGSDFENLDLLPSHFAFRNLDIDLDGMKRSKKRLHDLAASLQDEYDLLVFDCPPNITLVSENVFQAADFILHPVIPTVLSVRTYEKLRDFFKKEKLDREKIIAFFSMVEKRKSMHTEIMEQIKSQYDRLLLTMIPYASDVEKMGLYREPVVSARPTAPASLAYAELWAEFKKQYLRGKLSP